MRGLFVTATDTGVGKTEVACALVSGARQDGLDVGVMKPAQSGVTPGVASDAERLAAAAGGGDPPALVCPHSFAAPLAPGVAARLAGVTISLSALVDAARALAARHQALLVEGAGGLLVPLTPTETYADLMVALGLPVLVVARAGLGTVNHTALTVEALRARRLRLAGIVLNRTSPDDDPSVPENAAELARLTGLVVLASLPYCADIAGREAKLRSALRGKVQFS
ncbi:MAG: dethiobiotin synthase [Anaeromyxobacter sp.]|nr:dethiobiotin synthase [Anaeromyxobacter sp.]MBL0278249.1 dethiobiotin synthase [Anaeromyxobacter sp.]